MSLYADYLNERTDDQIIESENGFVVYRYLHDRKAVYIVDIYVIPSEREKGAAGQLAELVTGRAKGLGFTQLLGSVRPSAKGSTTSLRVLLGYGFELMSAGDDAIIFCKEI